MIWWICFQGLSISGKVTKCPLYPLGQEWSLNMFNGVGVISEAYSVRFK